MNTAFASFPFLRYCMVLIAGILLAGAWPSGWPYHIWLLMGLGLFYILFWKLSGPKFRTIQGFLGLLFLLYLGYHLANTRHKKAITDKQTIEKLSNFIQLKVNNLSEEKTNFWKTKALIEGSDTEVLLYLKKQNYPKPSYGDSYLVKAKATEIEGPKNPYEFDYKYYLHLQGIHYQVFVYNHEAILSGNSPNNSLYHLAYTINTWAEEIFEKYIADKQNLAVLNAMVLGLRDDIDHELLQAYSAAGAIHVLSVSGLHVGVIMQVLVGLLGFLKKRKKWGNYVYIGIILGFLWLYALVTGMSAPVMRSTFMFSLILLADTFQYSKNSINTLSISAFFILLFQPLILFSVGFLLSYLAVLGMILIQPLLNPLVVLDKHKNKFFWLSDRLWKVTTVAVAAQIATLPITIYYFHQFPNYFLLANPIVILLSSFALIAGLVFLLVAPLFQYFQLSWLLKWSAFIVEYLIKLLNDTVLYTERLPGAISNFLNYNKLEVLLLYALILSVLAIFYLKKYFWVKASIALTVMLMAINVFSFLTQKNTNQVHIHAIPKAVAISHVVANKAKLYTLASFANDNKNMSFRLNNYWSNMGVTDTTTILLDSANVLLNIKNKWLLLLQKPLKSAVAQKIDYLIVNHKKLSFDKHVAPYVNFRYVLLGGAFTKYYSEKFVKEAARKKRYVYVLAQQGALQF